MDKASEKRNFINLFGPMPKEELDRQKRDFPLNEPLTPEQRQDAVDWLFSPNGGGVKVKLVSPYNDTTYKNALIESLLLHPWFAPSKDLANRILLKGTSAHHVTSSTIPLNISEGSPRRLDLAIKPSTANKARLTDELKRIEKFKARGINTIEPFGVIEIDDNQGHASYLLTVLKKGILPLQKINFEQLKEEHRDLKMKQFSEVMEGLAHFIADMHNRGAIQGDLYLRNIAIDLNQEDPEEFVVFDLERSTILGDEKLGLKSKVGITVQDNILQGFKDFEDKAIDDVASLSADIAVKNENLTKEKIFNHFVRPYIEARGESQGQYSTEEFLNRFNQKYNDKLDKLSKAANFEKQLLQ